MQKDLLSTQYYEHLADKNADMLYQLYMGDIIDEEGNYIKCYCTKNSIKWDNLLGQELPRVTCICGEFMSCGKWSWPSNENSLWLHPMSTRSQSVSSPSQSCCHALFSRIKNNALRRGDFIHLRPLSAERLGCPVPLVVEGLILWTASLPHSMGKIAKDGATWELIRDLGHPGSSLLSWL